ncbi:type II CRISPR-associated endonuclease Cas1 [Gracilibacillus thailandensis]|uniref:CRISPR-associated endonuclease Cas1 n=1 Tax=Gracilibacillus thailandensis TaxID=563735 RepID=A0A6N7QY69_9BACI|nr:type II CRISPR-associated endonuclease Cas1 [Gracilibacillus thailandensis]MRI65831.1 type II CRISPR-associated endonuclease Cas1 [Gracilibacillus thailandensis]
MGWRIIHITNVDQLSLQLDNLKVKKSDDELKIPLRDIFAIIIEDLTCKLTSRLMIELSKNNILVLLCNQKYLPECVIQPVTGHALQFRQMMKQLNWTHDLKGILWKEIIQRKIINQAEVMRRNYIEKNRIAKLNELATKVENQDTSNVEGQAARIYFNSFFDENYTRSNQNYIENAALNYGYAIAHSAIARTIVAKGLISGLGIYHRGERNPHNLASDIIEPFRPIIDYFVVKHPPDGYLTKDYRIQLINLLHSKIVINNKMQTFIRAIEISIDSFLEFFETGKSEKIQLPSLEKLVLHES